MSKKRELYFFKDYFEKFYENQNEKVQKKILCTLKFIEEIDRIPEIYLKHLKNTSGLLRNKSSSWEQHIYDFLLFRYGQPCSNRTWFSKEKPENS